MKSIPNVKIREGDETDLEIRLNGGLDFEVHRLP